MGAQPRVVEAAIKGSIRIPTDELGIRATERVIQAFSFDNPEWTSRRRMKLPTHGIDRRFSVATVISDAFDDEYLDVPRGAAGQLAEVLKKDGVRLRYEDRRVRPNGLPELADLDGRDYQIEAADRLSEGEQGQVIIPTGGGKTRAALLTIRQLNTPTLIGVHTKDLCDQWVERIEEKLGYKPATYGGRKKKLKPITVAMMQSLERATDVLDKFGLFIVDECHHVAAPTWRATVNRSPSRFRLGLTATADRDDGLRPLLDIYLGAPLIELEYRDLFDRGVLVRPTVQGIATSFRYPYRDRRDWNPMMADLCEDETRNALIVEHIKLEVSRGAVCLVITGRKEHCHTLDKILEQAGVFSRVLTSKEKAKTRKAAVHAARAERIDAIISTSLADEGLDIPQLAALFLVYPGRALGRTKQRLGRMVRPSELEPMIYDFIDLRTPILRDQARARRKLFEELLGTEQQIVMEL